MKKNKLDNFFSDYKKLVNKGNIFSLATGIIIGAAFTAIVNSLVNDIVMPLVSRLINFDLTKAKWILRDEVLDSEGEILISEISVNYGNFIQNVVNFVIITLAIFVAMKVIKSIRNSYVKNEIKYVKNLKKRHPELFDEEDEFGTRLYEKLKTEHPEYFENEIAEEIDNMKEQALSKTPIEINNELLERLNENIEKLNAKNE